MAEASYTDRAMESIRGAFRRATYGDSFAGAAHYIGQEAAGHKVTILSDSNHGNMDRKALMASPELAAEARKAGVTHLGLELPKSQQVLIDRLADKSLSKNTFVNMMVAQEDAGIVRTPGLSKSDLRRSLEDRADTIINASNQGIKVVALDAQQGTTITTKSGKVYNNGFEEPMGKFWDDYSKKAQQSPSFNPEKSLTGYKASSFNDGERAAQFKKDFFENPTIKNFQADVDQIHPDKDNKMRMFQDREVAREIKGIVDDGGKVLVDYGQGHTKRAEGDIDASLKKNGVDVKTIEVHGNVKDFQDSYARCQGLENTSDRCESPYAKPRIFLDKGTLEAPAAEGTTPKVTPLASMAP